MRNLAIVGILCGIAVGCTPKLSFQQLAQFEGNVQAERSGSNHSADIKHVELWYMGHRLGYEYYHYEYEIDSPEGPQRIEKKYRYRDADAGDIHGSFWPAYVGHGVFAYTTDRTKWVKFPEGLSDSALNQLHSASYYADPTTRPGYINFDDLHQ